MDSLGIHNNNNNLVEIQLNFVDFVSLLRLSHFGLKTQFWDLRAFCKSSARTHGPHLRLTQHAHYLLRTQARQGISYGCRWLITLIYWLWNALVSTQGRPCTQRTDHTVTKCKFVTLLNVHILREKLCTFHTSGVYVVSDETTELKRGCPHHILNCPTSAQKRETGSPDIVWLIWRFSWTSQVILKFSRLTMGCQG